MITFPTLFFRALLPPDIQVQVPILKIRCIYDIFTHQPMAMEMTETPKKRNAL